MPTGKYYVTALPLKVEITAQTAEQAAVNALRNHGRGKMLGPYTVVCESGWNCEDFVFSTDKILKLIYDERVAGSG